MTRHSAPLTFPSTGANPRETLATAAELANATAAGPEGLSTGALRDLASTLGVRERLWRPLVHVDPQQRTFTELASGPTFSAWLIVWMEGHDTGWHDHDGCAGAVAVLQGVVSEARLRVGPGPEPVRQSAGTVFSFDGDAIHRIRHAEGEPAITLHVYSPPLRRTGAYTIDQTGGLHRLALAEGEELRPLG